MIKIGFDAKRYFHNNTGLGNYSRDLVRILHKDFPENEYHLFNTKHNNRFELQQGQFEHLPSTRFWKFFRALWRLWGINTQIRQLRPHIFHGLSGELPLGLNDTGTKQVVTVHDLIFLRYPQLYPRVDRFFYYLKTKHAIRVADGIIAISEQTKLDLNKFLKVPLEKINVIYQGCAEAYKVDYPVEEMEEVRQKYNLPDQFLLNVGTIEARKNALSIVKAIKDINIALVLVGRQTKYQRQIDEYVTANGMQDRIIYLSGVPLTDLAKLYRLATIFVYPSIFEGFGIPIIEALYARVPVITSAGGVFPEAGGPYSIYIDPYDHSTLTEAINRLFNSPELRHDMAEKGYLFAQKFNDDVISTELMAYYKGLMDK